MVEESPSPVVSEELRASLGEAAASLARAAGYVGAGTAEYLVSADDPDEFFFLEVNARLQVEHPVTEEVTGLDLVEQQLLVATGAPLALAQEDVRMRGHAIEVRLCAEDPAAGFLPATGTLAAYREPTGPGVRVDSGVHAGSVVGADYDSLLAKIIATGEDRAEVLERLSRALNDVRVLGVATNAGFLSRLVAAPEVQAGDMDTGLIERGVVRATPGPEATREAAMAVAVIETLALHDHEADADPWARLVGFRLDGPAPVAWQLEPADGRDQALEVNVCGSPADASVTIGDWTRHVEATRIGPGVARVMLGARARRWDHVATGPERWVASGPDAFAFRVLEPVVEGAHGAADGALEAPMPGTVLAVHVACGDEVGEGDALLVMESMKMELTITAPSAATVAEVLVATGDGVRQGQSLVELEATA